MEEVTADHGAVEKFIDKFTKVTADENLIPEQVYNSDKALLFGHYCSRKTLITADETVPMRIKDAENGWTALGCANTAGTHNYKLAEIAKAYTLSVLKEPIPYQFIMMLVNQHGSPGTSFPIDITNIVHISDCAYRREAELDDNCKIFLFFDNCSAYPPAKISLNNAYAVYFPPNVTSLAQPCDQGILKLFRNKCENIFLDSVLATMNRV